MLSVSRSTDNALTPLTLPGTNGSINIHPSLGEDASVPLSASLVGTTASYSAPFAAFACMVQNARPLLPGQPLPEGVAAFALATPVPLQK